MTVSMKIIDVNCRQRNEYESNLRSNTVSSVGTALHRYHGGHRFKSRTGGRASVAFITAKSAFLFFSTVCHRPSDLDTTN